MKERSRVNQKLVVASNIPNDNNHSVLGFQHESRCEKARESGLFFVARQHAILAYRCYQQEKNKAALIRISTVLGDINRQLELFSLAQKNYLVATRLCSHTIQFQQEKHDARVGYALALRGSGQYEKCLRQLKLCLSFYEKNHDREGMAFVLWARGTTHRFLGNISVAENELKKSLTIYKTLKDVSGTAYAKAGLGGTLRMKGWAQESEKLYREANAVFRKKRDQFGMAYSFCGIGNGLRMQNKVNEGMAFSQKAEKLYRKLGQKGPLAFVLWSKAQALILQKKFGSAAKHLSETKLIFRQVSDARGLMYVDLGWGIYFYAQQKKSTAQVYFQKALKTAIHKKLLIEKAAALQYLAKLKPKNKKLTWDLYKKCGADPMRLKSYLSLP